MKREMTSTRSRLSSAGVSGFDERSQVVGPTSVREQLETDLREAERELQRLRSRVEDRPNLALGRGNAGGYSWEMALTRRKAVINRIQALQEALVRVREGTYGRCSRCGAQIDPERLEILPATTLCVACARSVK